MVRYVPWARLRKDENENVVGVLAAAFRLREGEEYLSVTWAEFFQKAVRSENLQAAIRAIRGSRVAVKPLSGFAIGNVRGVADVCLADNRRHKVRIVHEPTDDNGAHVAVRGWPRDNEPLLELLANDAWSEVILNKSVPP
jgi:hypothetical protein